MTPPREWTFKGHGLTPLSLNDRDHGPNRAARVAQWREIAGALAKDRRIPALARAHVVLVLRPPFGSPARRRDADNMVATLKAVIDGLVDAGVLADDTPAHVTWDPPAIEANGHLPYWSYAVLVRETE